MASRYELKEKLGEGGMGVVYRARDTRTNGDVAIKTLRDATDPATRDLFGREWAELVKLVHPNIVRVQDVDEIEEDGVKKPCFVMPLLQGDTLAALIKSGSPRLTVEFVVNVICQVCKGLQAAHDHPSELIHRDLKPSNIMIGSDDTPIIIDFGLVHSTGHKSVSGLKGTWQYMAPEQVDGKAPTRRTDIYSLGVVAYEALTGVQPFKRNKLDDTVEAIRNFIPQAISEKNPKVPEAVSKAIHVAMAKQPINRYGSAREFAETLQKAFTGQYIERFDPARIQPRIDRAKRAFASGDTDFASEILRDLESEGNLAPEITLLRQQIFESTRQKKIRKLLEDAQTRLEEKEYAMALQKLSEILELDPQHPEALSMRRKTEGHISEQEVSTRLRLAQQYFEHFDFQKARSALKEVFRLKYDEPSAAKLMAEIDDAEKEADEARDEKQSLYSSALRAQQNGEISSAFSKMEKLIGIGRSVPGATHPEKDRVYHELYNEVRTERDRIQSAYEEGLRCLNEKNFEKALGICDGILYKYPKNAQFVALKLKLENAQREALSAYLADVGRAVDNEPNLDRKVGLLEEACKRYPDEAQLQRQLASVRNLRDVVASIVSKARSYEEQGQYGEAISQWKILADTYPAYPGLDFEVSQLEWRRDQQSQADKKARSVAKIDRALGNSAFDEAIRLCRDALTEFPQDPELLAMSRVAQTGLERSQEAHRLLDEAKASRDDGHWDAAIDLLRQAFNLNKRNILVRNTLVNVLLEHAHSLLDTNWEAAEPLAAEADRLDPEHHSVKRLLSTIEETRRKTFVETQISQARELQGDNAERARDIIKQALLVYPGDPRLKQTLLALGGQASDSAQPQGTEPWTIPLNGELPTVPYPASPQSQAAAAPKLAPIRQPIPEPEPKGPGAPQKIAELLDSPKLPAVTRTNWFRGVVLGLLAALIVLPLMWLMTRETPPTPPPPATKVKFELRTKPEDAEVTLDGKVTTNRHLEFEKGSKHQFSVTHPGYKPVQTAFDVDGRDLPPFVLEAEPLHASISVDDATSVVWDNHRESDPQDGQWTADYALTSALTPHTLVVKGRSGTLLSFQAKVAAGEVPEVEQLNPRELIVIASFGTDATIYSGDSSSVLAIPDKPRQPIPAGGLKVKIEDAPPDGFPVVSGTQTNTLPVMKSNGPALSVSLQSTAPVRATANITATNRDAVLTVDGGPMTRARRRPGFWSWALLPGVYHASLRAPGMMEQKFDIRIRRGETFNRKFTLQPEYASLTVESAPGAEVFIGPNKIGETDASGHLSYSNVEPGTHEVTIKKGRSENKSSQHFEAGATISLNWAPKSFGYVQITLYPPDAKASYRASGAQAWKPVENPKQLDLAPGSYEFRAEAQGYAPSQIIPQRIAADKTTSFPISLQKIDTPPPPPSPIFDPPASVRQTDGGWLMSAQPKAWVMIRAGVSNLKMVFYREKAGVFSHKRLSWSVFLDEENTFTYSIEGQNLTISRTFNGRKVPNSTIKAALANGDQYVAIIHLEKQAVRITNQSGDQVDNFQDGQHDWTHARISIRSDSPFTAMRN